MPRLKKLYAALCSNEMVRDGVFVLEATRERKREKKKERDE